MTFATCSAGRHDAHKIADVTAVRGKDGKRHHGHQNSDVEGFELMSHRMTPVEFENTIMT